VLCCTNAAVTHRVKLLVTGKHQRPRAFENVRHLPVEFTGQSHSWTDRQIFKHWFLHTFVTFVKEHFCKTGMPEDSKCILLLDNCNAHPNELELRSGNMCVVYFPPNVTALIQPMDQEVIQNMKCYYRRDILRKFGNHEGTMKDVRLWSQNR
jgi:hypothetical protein